ncbi:hypothetical protein OHB56_15460 [Streptomyces sp. NBC_01635]|uniref:hypothetical protein n=1 Tax=Streptomyces sp. NBC_01635 TaxID=2975904 RepID=UPI00386D6F7E|nr:hypothetical protein OHB56_15460 [Streptomyces sp. NBC_01635]
MPKKQSTAQKKARKLTRSESVPYSVVLAQMTAPAADDQRILVGSIGSKLDLQQMLAEAMKPKLDLQRALTRSHPS